MKPGRRIGFEDLVRFDSLRKTESVRYIAGVDEAGRGALAGPVVAAAVICEPSDGLSRVRDSKLLGERERERLYDRILQSCVASSIGIVGPEEIDRINILRAAMKAMREAVERLETKPCLVLVDGPRLPGLAVPAEAVTGGDRRSFVIAAASIIAKVTRDRIMREHASVYRAYGFARNKGYGTEEHLAAIRKRGRTELHRMTFKVHVDV